LDIERLRAFYRTWYRPDNATLIVTGRFDGPALRGWIAEHFGAHAQQELRRNIRGKFNNRDCRAGLGGEIAAVHRHEVEVTFESEVRADPLGDFGDPNGGFGLSA
jgi:hypothetical protein